MFLNYMFHSLFIALCICVIKTHGSTFYSLSALNIANEKINFEDYRGKVVVIVNVASECGFTDGHYKALSRVYNLMEATGKFTVLGFPCNQFGAQEPGDNEQILQFVLEQYDVKFPMFSKIDVYGENQHGVYRFLQEKTNEVPNWNFWKFLVNHEGKVLGAWSPRQDVEEMMEHIVQAVRAATNADGSEPKPPPPASKPMPPDSPRHDDL